MARMLGDYSCDAVQCVFSGETCGMYGRSRWDTEGEVPCHTPH